MAVVKHMLTYLSLLTLCSACGRPETAIRSEEVYFDLKGYFANEAQRLNRAKPKIQKSVIKNKEEETRQLEINDWENELTLFTHSDINKPAWANSYRIDSLEDRVLEYQATDPDLRTKSIRITRKQNGDISGIYIKNATRNLLYESRESLSYVPDSFYRVEKTQTVRFIGTNHYELSGSVIQP